MSRVRYVWGLSCLGFVMSGVCLSRVCLSRVGYGTRYYKTNKADNLTIEVEHRMFSI